MKPVLDRIIIKQDEGDDKVGAILLADTAREKPKRGTVVAVGPGGYSSDGTYIPMMTKVGDRVIYSEFAGANIVVDQEKYVVVKEVDLFVIL